MLLLALAPDATANFVRLYTRLRAEPAKLAAAMDVMHRFQQLAAAPADEQEVQRLVGDLVALYPGWLGETHGATDIATAEAASRVFADHLHSYSLAQRRVIETVSAIAPRARMGEQPAARSDLP
ncbi:hypothetical protein [Planosporangium thailandense]|uniref:hypothetical protein n=1 Tax=Planosporangium thailandense TaxID=765197 RepID=UPI001F0EC739|nr:hypothetical protein [Planosporangium thailandense]